MIEVVIANCCISNDKYEHKGNLFILFPKLSSCVALSIMHESIFIHSSW